VSDFKQRNAPVFTALSGLVADLANLSEGGRTEMETYIKNWVLSELNAHHRVVRPLEPGRQRRRANDGARAEPEAVQAQAAFLPHQQLQYTRGHVRAGRPKRVRDKEAWDAALEAMAMGQRHGAGRANPS